MPRTSNKAELIMDYVNQFIQENGYSHLPVLLTSHQSSSLTPHIYLY